MKAMKFRALVGGAVLAAAVGSVVPALAHHAANPCTAPDQTVTTPAGTFYWDDREHTVVGDGYAQGYGTWIYQESNSKTGMQHKQGQVSIIDETDTEICTYPTGYTGTPDTLIF